MTATVSIGTGLELAREKQYDKAVQVFTSFLSHNKTHGDASFYRGCAYLHLSQYEKAIGDFGSAISSPNLSFKHDLPALYKRGYAHYKLNKFHPALDDYRDYLNHCQNHQEQHHLRHKGEFQMGVIHATLNENTKAITHFTHAIEWSAGTEEDKQKLYYLHRGRTYACDAKYDKAQADLQLVLEQSNDLFVKGCAYNELGQHGNALKEFDDLLKSNGNGSKLVETYHDHILFRLGLSCASLNSHDEALSNFQSALNLPEQQTSSNIIDRILFRKGMSYMALNNSHKALVDFNDSTTLNNNQSDVFYARGMLHYKLGRHDAAVYDQRKAMELERKSPSAGPVYKSYYHMDKHDNTYNNYIYYKNKIREAEKSVQRYKRTPYESIIHRRIAEYIQRQAPFSKDPVESCTTAGKHIKEAARSSNESPVANSIARAVNSYYKAQCIAEKYSNRDVPVSAMEEYIQCAAKSILKMSRLFDNCVTKECCCILISELLNDLNKSNIQQGNSFDIVRNTYIQNQLEKAEILQKAMDLFADSPAQQEFYKLLLTRLWNLFDGVRTASAGLFSHALEGTLTKVSWIFKFLGKLFSYAPVASQYGETVFGLCGSGLKKLDEERIQNALNALGNLLDPTIANKTADAIVKELTVMYEKQIIRFPTKTEMTDATADNNNNSQQQEQTAACSGCTNCWAQCCRCLGERKDGLLNKVPLSTIGTIVEYGVTLLLSCLIKLDVKDIENTEDILNVFVNGVCRSSDIIIFPSKILADKIKPKDVTEDKERWNTYDFFRRPPIGFENGTIRAKKLADIETFGCRKATLAEKHSLETDSKELNKCGFKISVENDNLS